MDNKHPPSRAEKDIRLAARFYEARSTSRALMGDKYMESISPHIVYLREEAKRTGKSLLATCADLVKRFADEGRDMAIMAMLAATVEAIESDGGKNHEKALADLVNLKEPLMPDPTPCSTCADLVAGLCRSPSETAQKLRATWRDEEKRDPPECDDWREISKRPGVDEDLQQAFEHFVEAIDAACECIAADSWKAMDYASPEQQIQHSADGAAIVFRGLRKALPMADLGQYLDRDECSLDAVHGRIICLLTACPELEKARGHMYRLTWRLSKWTDKGSACWGQSKPIPESTREKCGIKEDWDLTLSLPVWMLLDDVGRERLLHHELMHAARLDRGHQVEEWPETAARFGALTRDQGLLACAIVAHPSTPERVMRWGLIKGAALPGGQVSFLEVDGGEGIEIRIPKRLEGAPDLGIIAAIESMRPKAGSGVESVTLSSGGRSVTITAESAARAAAAIKRMGK